MLVTLIDMHIVSEFLFPSHIGTYSHLPPPNSWNSIFQIMKHVVSTEDNNSLTFTPNLMHLSIFLVYLGITVTPDAHTSTEY